MKANKTQNPKFLCIFVLRNGQKRSFAGLPVANAPCYSYCVATDLYMLAYVITSKALGLDTMFCI